MRTYIAAVFAVSLATSAVAQTIPGRLLSKTGAASGGIIAFNPDAKVAFNLTPNTFSGSAYHDTFAVSNTRSASISDDGKTMAFLSSRNGVAQFVYVANGDGTGIRQLTFPYFQNYADSQAVISPDGKHIAFISYREAQPNPDGSTSRNPQLYEIDTDGTNLRQLTSGTAVINPSDYPRVDTLAVDWSPDSRTVAYRGVRIIPIDDQGRLAYFSVVGRIDTANGSDQVLFGTQSTGQSFSLDWSPSGNYILAGFGNEAQGAPAGRVLIYDTRTGHLGEDYRVDDPTGLGNIRVAPDDSCYAVPYGDGIYGYRLVGLDSPVGVQSYPFHSIAYAEMYWQPGPNWPKPVKLVVQKDPFAIPRGFDGQFQVEAVLYGKDGSVLSRLPQQWDVVSGGYDTELSDWGDLKDRTDRDGGVSTFRAFNGGYTSNLFTVQNGTPNVVFSNLRVEDTGDTYTLRVTVQNMGDARIGDGTNPPVPAATLSGVPMTLVFGYVPAALGSPVDLGYTIPKSQATSGRHTFALRGRYDIGGYYAGRFVATIP